jgi:hypothetical protein
LGKNGNKISNDSQVEENIKSGKNTACLTKGLHLHKPGYGSGDDCHVEGIKDGVAGQKIVAGNANGETYQQQKIAM